MRKKSQDTVVTLMDDCMSELDAERQSYLWSRLATCDQVFLTGTEDGLSHLPSMHLRLWNVSAGSLTPV